MKSGSFYAAYLLKKLWTLAALLLVFIAVAMSVLRYSLPYLDKQKHRVEHFLSEQYGVELAIGEMSAGWSGIGPTLILADVELKQSEQSPIALNIMKTQVEIDFWGSLVAQQIQSTQFDLSGLNLTIDLNQIRSADSDFPIVEALERLFLEQLQRFAVTDSTIRVISEADEQLIQVQQLTWINRDQRHQGVGQMRVVELANNSASFTLDLFGDIDNLNGTFYAKAEELDLSPWLNQLVKTENQLTESRGNFTFWAGIEKSKVTGAQVEVGDSVFAWETAQETVSMSILGGNFRGVPDASGWTFNLDNFALQTAGQSLISSWAGHINRKGHLRFNNISSLDIKTLLPMLPVLLDNKTTQFIEQLSPSAIVQEVKVSLDDSLTAFIRFSDLGWNQVDNIPGIKDIYGELNLHNKACHITLFAQNGLLEIDNMLDSNIPFEQFSVDAFIDQQAGWTLTVPEIRFESELVSLEHALSYQTDNDLLTIIGSFEPTAMGSVKKLLPAELMGQDTRDYLVGALQSGEVQAAQLLWYGSPSEFPYADNQGVFQATVEVADATLTFDDAWPALTELDIDLLFENESLTMISNAGRLQDVRLKDLTAVIPKLAKGAILTIDAVGSAVGKDVSDLMLASNLADSVGKVLTEGVQLNGKLNANLNLHIPLTGEDVIATGEINLVNNSVYIPSIEFLFENATGKVNFVNDKVTFSNLKADLLGQPVWLGFAGADGGQSNYTADIAVNGDWQVAPLLDTYHSGLSAYVSGNGDWQADVTLDLREEEYHYTANIESQLSQLESNLPAPFAKQVEQDLPFKLTSEGNNTASNINLLLGEKIAFSGILPHKELKFSRAHLSVGNSELVSMGLGFSISANLPELDFGEWYQALTALLEGMPESDNPILGEPQRIYVDAQTMLVAGQKIDKLQLIAKHSNDDWQLEFNAEQMRAKVMLYYDWLEKGIEVEADFIDLAEWQGENKETTMQPNLANLPPVTFVCKQCRFNGKDLGKIDIKLSRAADGMKIDRLQMINSNGKLDATGDWLLTNQNSSTQLVGEFRSADFGAFLKGFEVNSGIKDSKANFQFDLEWQKAPYAFNFESLRGEVDWGLTDGYLTEVSDKGSRIFSFLSLQSLVRKLSLDFRDVFSKGFFYDKMQGSFQIAGGTAYTKDTVIDGAAGEMTITGSTDLNSKILDYRIGFTPNVTSSLPLLVYWMVNPATAIAALAIDQVLTEAKVISNVQYSLTGSFDEPVLEELDRKSKEISLPAQAPPEVLEQQGINQAIPDELQNPTEVHSD